MPDKDKTWKVAFGERGGPSSDPITEMVRANEAEKHKKDMERSNEISELQHKAKKAELEKEVKGEDRTRMKDLEEKSESLQEEVHKKEIELVKIDLGSKIDKLSESIKEGASTKSIASQIGELKSAALEMGLGGSKISEFQEIATFIDKMKPTKSLSEQIKEAKAILEPLEGEKLPAGQLPPSIALEIKKMETNLTLEIERMKDERDRRDKEWEMEKFKWAEDRELKRQEIEGKLAVEKERNELLGGAVKKLGGAIGRIGEEGGGAPAVGGIASKIIEAEIGDFGEVPCAKCGSAVPIAKDATKAICPGCTAVYSVRRVKTEVPVESETD